MKKIFNLIVIVIFLTSVSGCAIKRVEVAYLEEESTKFALIKEVDKYGRVTFSNHLKKQPLKESYFILINHQGKLTEAYEILISQKQANLSKPFQQIGTFTLGGAFFGLALYSNYHDSTRNQYSTKEALKEDKNNFASIMYVSTAIGFAVGVVYGTISLFEELGKKMQRPQENIKSYYKFKYDSLNRVQSITQYVSNLNNFSQENEIEFLYENSEILPIKSTIYYPNNNTLIYYDKNSIQNSVEKKENYKVLPIESLNKK